MKCEVENDLSEVEQWMHEVKRKTWWGINEVNN